MSINETSPLSVFLTSETNPCHHHPHINFLQGLLHPELSQQQAQSAQLLKASILD